MKTQLMVMASLLTLVACSKEPPKKPNPIAGAMHACMVANKCFLPMEIGKSGKETTYTLHVGYSNGSVTTYYATARNFSIKRSFDGGRVAMQFEDFGATGRVFKVMVGSENDLKTLVPIVEGADYGTWAQAAYDFELAQAKDLIDPLKPNDTRLYVRAKVK